MISLHKLCNLSFLVSINEKIAEWWINVCNIFTFIIDFVYQYFSDNIYYHVIIEKHHIFKLQIFHPIPFLIWMKSKMWKIEIWIWAHLPTKSTWVVWGTLSANLHFSFASLLVIHWTLLLWTILSHHVGENVVIVKLPFLSWPWKVSTN